MVEVFVGVTVLVGVLVGVFVGVFVCVGVFVGVGDGHGFDWLQFKQPVVKSKSSNTLFGFPSQIKFGVTENAIL